MRRPMQLDQPCIEVYSNQVTVSNPKNLVAFFLLINASRLRRWTHCLIAGVKNPADFILL
ncbi:MAG: hypothetical protein KME49_19455 [Brasilonema octagenarum HA4186-MV1]|jgi:hypothetical protein|nr:hypothetical protein [Brasilonema octagenarum HA4186-MV1]